MTGSRGHDDLVRAWQEAIGSAEHALRGDGVTRAQVATAVGALCGYPQLLGRPSVGQDVTYLLSLLDSLGLYDTSRLLMKQVVSSFGQHPGALNMDAAVRNQLAVAFAERGHLTTAAMLLAHSAEGGSWPAATLANQACVMLRLENLEGAADTAARARRAAVSAGGDHEAEGQLDVQVLATAVLAEVFRQVGRDAEADQLLDELEGFVRRLVRLLGGNHPKSLSALVTLASAEFESARAAGEHERMERAGDVIAIAAQRLSATLGAEHPRSLSALQSHATVEYEAARVLMGGRLQGARALMTAAARHADALHRWDPRSLDLDDVIELGRAAVASTPDDHPDRAAHLARLGDALQARFAHTGTQEDLNEAIDMGRAAVAATPDQHPVKALILTSFGDALQARFAHTGAQEDLIEVIEVRRAAVASTPDDHPDRAVYLARLGSTLHAWVGRTRAYEDLIEATDRAAHLDLLNASRLLRTEAGQELNYEELERLYPLLGRLKGTGDLEGLPPEVVARLVQLASSDPSRDSDSESNPSRRRP
ncbi:hypothetical protein [Streptomyces sp. Ag109_G2-15]|uniref:hypothetical protein n=1 Tax=Streptomyces sp. Ag109_G2-15 TaxID=1938850 RepID=UPI000BC5CEDF|nr:hypothetical protein [Streptomyces sp. Ag109_G2-15]SOE06465.1 hypothetical protein SAMN06272765_7279 [Streptomyces sp. Ag109_G2-15]